MGQIFEQCDQRNRNIRFSSLKVVSEFVYPSGGNDHFESSIFRLEILLMYLQLFRMRWNEFGFFLSYTRFELLRFRSGIDECRHTGMPLILPNFP